MEGVISWRARDLPCSKSPMTTHRLQDHHHRPSARPPRLRSALLPPHQSPSHGHRAIFALCTYVSRLLSSIIGLFNGLLWPVYLWRRVRGPRHLAVILGGTDYQQSRYFSRMPHREGYPSC